AGDSAFGIAQRYGNGWEWTRSLFQPFPGFAPSPAYPGYSANFFDGEHFVLKGASCATPAALLRASFRNWFRKDYPYAYTTFRVVDTYISAQFITIPRPRFRTNSIISIEQF